MAYLGLRMSRCMYRLSCRRHELPKFFNKVRCSRKNPKNNCVRHYLTTTSGFRNNCMGSSIARNFALSRAGSRYTVARSFNVGIELSMMEIEKQIAEYQVRIRELYQRAMYREAIDVVVEAAEMAEDHYGEEHPVCASLYNNCALFHKCLGEYDEAITLYNRAMRIYKKVVGETHKSTTTCMLNIGTVLKAQAAGKTGQARIDLLESARDAIEGALAGKRESMGEEHFEVGNVLYVLGGVHNDLKEYDEAEKVLEESLSLLTKRFKTTRHPLVAAAQNNMGVVLKATGRFDEALDMYQQALDTRTMLLEPDHHPEILATKFNIAELWTAMGHEDRANALREQILEHTMSADEGVVRPE